jgi:Spy/CpxP family protein refolding chaperone
MRPGFDGPGPFEQLGLTEDQRTKIRQQRLEHRKVNEKLGSDLRIKRWDLQELMSAPTQDRAKIDAKLKELSDLRLARQKAGLDQHDAMLKILTPEQREKMKQMRPGGGPRPGMRREE